MNRVSKLWKRIMDEYHRPVIPTDSIIWDYKKHELGIGTYKTTFVAPNRAIIQTRTQIFLFYFKNKRLHAAELGEDRGH